MLTPRQTEKIIKGFSNHTRIKMLILIDGKPELSVFEISRELKINHKTASEHLRRLTIAGLLLKHNRANNVLHILSPRGKSILKFLRILD